MNGVYFEFIKKAYKSNSTYRANSYINIITSALELSVQISIWYALLGHGAVKGISYLDMINYTIINLIVGTLIHISIADDIGERIRDGTIAIDFIRPVKFKYYLICNNIGNNLYETVYNTLPVCIIAFIFLKFKLPVNPTVFIMFLISIVLGIILSYMINYVLGLFVFWFKTGFHIRWVLGACNALFAGSVVPIWFYPGVLYKISKMLPFRLVSFEPISIYLGKTSLYQSVYVILSQVIWIIILSIAEKIIWSKAQKVVVVQGG